MSNNILDLSLSSDELFDNNIDKIMENAKNIKDKILEPTMDEKIAIYNIVMQFIKDKKRKIYGGFALNKLLIDKNKDDAIYDDKLDEPDIDFYSPEPIKDMIEICNIIHSAGYKQILGKEAQHVGTYKIHVNWNKECCDITYVPNNIYKKIRFIEIDGYYYTHPCFMMIDMFRVFTDILSYRNLPKYDKRFIKLEKYYPMPCVNKILKMDPYKNKNITKTLDDVFENFLITRNTLLFSGYYTYNCYLEISKIFKINSGYKFLNLPYYELYSINYINDGLDLLEYFKTSEYAKNIEYDEHYPLFQYFGYSTVFFFVDGNKRYPIIYLYDNNKRCTPFKKIEAKIYNNDKIVNKETEINIGTFDFNILHILIMLLKVRVDDNNDMNDILYTELNGIAIFRKHYLKEENKSKFDPTTIFQSYNATCMGKTIEPAREKRIRTDIRYKMKKPTEYKYDPEKNKNKIPKYTQANTSGHKIVNEKHFRLLDNKRHYNKEDIIKDEEENDNNMD